MTGQKMMAAPDLPSPRPSRGTGTYIVLDSVEGVMGPVVVESIDAGSYDEADARRRHRGGAMYALCGGEPNLWEVGA